MNNSKSNKDRIKTMQEDRKNYYAHLVEIIAWLMFDGKHELDRGILLYSDTPHLDEDGRQWKHVQYITEVLNDKQLETLDTILKEKKLQNWKDKKTRQFA